jgi:RNA polymerase-binding transcription factor DksA
MTHYETARRTLATRRGELVRRLARLEDDLESLGAAPDALHALPRSAPVALKVISDFMEALDREIGLIDSALRRIDSREYDCCLQCGATIEPERLERLPYTVNCKRCSDGYPVDYIHQLRSHHSSLRRTVFNVLHVLDDTAERCACPDGISTADVAGARALLRDLGRHLPARFEIEERGGYLAEALAAAPRFSRRATRLMRQHADFSRRIEALVKEAERAGTDAAAWDTTRDEFRELALDLLAHEQAESDIVESAFLDDLGGID